MALTTIDGRDDTPGREKTGSVVVGKAARVLEVTSFSIERVCEELGVEVGRDDEGRGSRTMRSRKMPAESQVEPSSAGR